ncbi:hypothetical protein ACWERW_32235 [Streptomyces sp. NPDC004012]
MRALAVAAKVRTLFPESEQHVYLGSKSTLLTPMFEGLGVHVHTASDQRDHANTSQLTRSFDWNSYVTGYLHRTFISGDRMLAAVALIGSGRPDVIVSDFNVAACLAAEISGVPYVLITERYDVTSARSATPPSWKPASSSTTPKKSTPSVPLSPHSSHG